MKVAAYACTPVWPAGVCLIMPVLIVIGFFSLVHALYLLFYLGLHHEGAAQGAAEYTAIVMVGTTPMADRCSGGCFGVAG